MNRRELVRNLVGLAAGSPLLPAEVPDELMGPVNVHEFEEVAKRKMHKLAYDFIAGGVEDEYTLRANREAYGKFALRPRVMTDVSNVSLEVDLLGMKLASPILIAPTGGKNLVIESADEKVAAAALASKTLICSATGVQKILEKGEPLLWWSNTIGAATKAQARGYARRIEDGGGRAITLTVDNQYQSNRDRNNRNRFDYGYMQTGVPKDGEPKPAPKSPALPAMWQPHTPQMTWEQISWLKEGAKIPVIVKGIIHPEDAALAVKHGADAIVVSNHGGRQLDGVMGTLEALPDCVDAVGGKVPVLMDGGLRRGTDILKAMALGAKAVLVGRAPLWGLGAFGQPGVERVLWMLNAELKLAMALAGMAKPGDITRTLVTRKLG
ncbi:MAG: alpha-hydroxy-acid oxidizing protein [Acidobacteriaceae bacterium]|jgi:isopentenyl diphosphate isomerase/L-lactate dehydrogenase-like FMN-dependent dehydrogenase|nr:alpha-hydroxy-acid oxidizing protein [Acidobacteriaceae bacterium]